MPASTALGLAVLPAQYGHSRCGELPEFGKGLVSFDCWIICVIRNFAFFLAVSIEKKTHINLWGAFPASLLGN